LSLWAVALLAAMPILAGAQQAGYPVTVIAPGKGPYTFPAGYQTPWEKIEVRKVSIKRTPMARAAEPSRSSDRMAC
jgi:hypothetical protein